MEAEVQRIQPNYSVKITKGQRGEVGWEVKAYEDTAQQAVNTAIAMHGSLLVSFPPKEG